MLWNSFHDHEIMCWERSWKRLNRQRLVKEKYIVRSKKTPPKWKTTTKSQNKRLKNNIYKYIVHWILGQYWRETSNHSSLTLNSASLQKRQGSWSIILDCLAQSRKQTNSSNFFRVNFDKASSWPKKIEPIKC